MTHLEIEYKTLLTMDEYKRLDSLYQHIKPFEQTNYYIDTPSGQLKNNRLSLRIRTLSNRAELTLKIPQTIGNIEHNQDLTLEQVKLLKQDLNLPEGEIREKLIEQGIDLSQLTILGHLTTRRREVPLAIGLLAIDSSHYAGIRDYELELEVSHLEQGKSDFDAFLEQHQIAFKYAKSKVARFAATLKNK